MKIPFTNYNLNFKKETQQSSTVEVDKKVFEALLTSDKYSSTRPSMDPYKSGGDTEVMVPILPLPMQLIFDVSRYSDTLSTIRQNLRKEIFRHGHEVVEAFSVKCEDCGKEFKNSTDECDDCGSTNLREPEIEQKKLLVKWCKSVNDNEQDIVNVSEELSDDYEVYDDSYALFTFDYLWSKDLKLIGKIPVEFLRIDPQNIFIIADRKGRPGRNQEGKRLLTCLVHREMVYPVDDGVEEHRCSSCGRVMQAAYFRATEPESGKYIYYTKDEVLHTSKYNPSLTYGFSNIYCVWMKVVTLMNMDQYMKDYYAKQRPPRGLLFVNTPNKESVEKSWNWMLDMFKKNPHIIPPICIEQTQGTKGKMVEFIDFMRSLDEMQYTELRNEYRRQIGAEYGVMPLFQADVSTSGGLNNEGLQITVTNRAVLDGQGPFNDKVYEWIRNTLNVTDYKIKLKPNEEQDMMAKEQIRSKKIENAARMQQMGFEVIMNEDGEFEFDPVDEPVEPSEQVQGPGGFPPFSSDRSSGQMSGQTQRPGTSKPPDMTAKSDLRSYQKVEKSKKGKSKKK